MVIRPSEEIQKMKMLRTLLVALSFAAIGVAAPAAACPNHAKGAKCACAKKGGKCDHKKGEKCACGKADCKGNCPHK
jgi:hypothetical protein